MAGGTIHIDKLGIDWSRALSSQVFEFTAMCRHLQLVLRHLLRRQENPTMEQADRGRLMQAAAPFFARPDWSC
jgi:hypothetical protein